MKRDIYDKIYRGDETNYSRNSDLVGPYSRVFRLGNYDGSAGEAAHSTPFLSHQTDAKPSPEVSLAGRVFGRQLAEGRAMIRHGEKLANERRQFHAAHIKELDHQRSEVGNRLSFACRPYSAAPPQQVVPLERLLFQIEAERQRAERSYWKDMAEIQKGMLESLFAYRANQDRSGLLGGLERSDA